MNLILLRREDFEHPDAPGGRVVVRDARRVRHLSTVIHAALGATLQVGCEGGQVGTAVVRALPGEECEGYALDVTLTAAPPPPSPVSLVLALPPRAAFSRVLHTATVLGVKRVHLVGCKRPDGQYWGAKELQPAAVRETMVLGLEQGVDTVLPEVELKPRLEYFLGGGLRQQLGAPGERRAYVLVPGGEAALPPAPAPGVEVTLVVGPEAGFGAEELARFEALGCERISFGPRRVPTETALHVLLGRLGV